MSSASAIDPMRTQRRRAGDTEQAEDEQRKIGPVGEGACDTGKRREIGEGAKLCICWRRSKLLRSARDYWLGRGRGGWRGSGSRWIGRWQEWFRDGCLGGTRWCQREETQRARAKKRSLGLLEHK
nr:hypothetical protein Iba_chr13cCG7370 [Ipomoea batatas]